MSEKTDMLKAKIMELRFEVRHPTDMPAMLSYYMEEFEKAIREEEQKKEPKDAVEQAQDAITHWAYTYMHDTRELDTLVRKLIIEVRLQDHTWHEQGMERTKKDILLFARRLAYWQSAFDLAIRGMNILSTLGPEPKE
jgi:hypothetical protein